MYHLNVWPFSRGYYIILIFKHCGDNEAAMKGNRGDMMCMFAVWSWVMLRNVGLLPAVVATKAAKTVLNPTHYLYVRSSKQQLAPTWDSEAPSQQLCVVFYGILPLICTCCFFTITIIKLQPNDPSTNKLLRSLRWHLQGQNGTNLATHFPSHFAYVSCAHMKVVHYVRTFWQIQLKPMTAAAEK